MNLSQLYYLRTLLEVGSYTRAAKELFVSQPALSESIHALEAELGMPLFRRQGRGIVPTPEGLEFGGYVDDALRILDRGCETVRNRARGCAGTIRIGGIPAVQLAYLPTLIRAFLESVEPNAAFDVREDRSDRLARDLLEGRLDVAVAHAPLEEDPGISFVPVFSRRLMACCSRSHPFARRRSVSSRDLVGENIASYAQSDRPGRSVHAFLEAKGIAVQRHSDGDLAVVGMTMADPAFVAVVLEGPWLSSFPGMVAIPIEDAPFAFCDVGLLYARESFKGPVLSSFLEFAAEFDPSTECDLALGAVPDGRP